MTTKVDSFIADLNGGVFEQKLSVVLSDVAGAVIDHGKNGKVIIELNMSRIGNSYQIEVQHKLKYNRPTSKGSIQEDELTSTPMHVGARGALSFFPENQGQLFNKKGGINNTDNEKFNN